MLKCCYYNLIKQFIFIDIIYLRPKNRREPIDFAVILLFISSLLKQMLKNLKIKKLLLFYISIKVFYKYLRISTTQKVDFCRTNKTLL